MSSQPPSYTTSAVRPIVRWMDLCTPLVQHFESCSLHAYWDPYGRCWTIGWGETGASVVSGLQWTQEQADSRLLAHLQQFGVMADVALTRSVLPQQKAAFVSILYNVGPGAVRTIRSPGRDGIIRLRSGMPSTLLHKLNVGDLSGCADEFLQWNSAGGVVLPGLVARREAERALFLTGDWS